MNPLNPTFDAKIDHELDVMVSPRKGTLDIFLDKCPKFSEHCRSTFGKRVETVKYGDGPKQSIDIVRPDNVKPDTPILLYIHGGCWISTSRDIYLFTAEEAVRRGWIAMIVGYDQCPDVSLTAIVDEIRDSYIFASNKFPDCGKMVVTGHSAGGHLAAMLLATDWAKYCPGQKVLPIARCIPISALFDVRLFVHTRYNEQLRLTEYERNDLSPIFNIDQTVANIKAFGTKVFAAVGEHEPARLIKMSEDYAQALNQNSADADVVFKKGLDHFQIVENLHETDYDLHKVIYGDE